ncbi:Hypothetical predicted protein [Pelobates cultripes]|uniref:Uncharacterized protein n=1 Tax=Pelobates cultripes TaxID=61616 RepID=A0AAD1S3F3_PELCU|nr:Hypothetical predicted protein [Pelobates cultripes]
MMEDDLDRLLDEVETKYCGSGAAGSTEGRNQREPSRCKKPVKKACAEDENIDDLIEDILNVHCKEENKMHSSTQLMNVFILLLGMYSACAAIVPVEINTSADGTNTVAMEASNQDQNLQAIINAAVVASLEKALARVLPIEPKDLETSEPPLSDEDADDSTKKNPSKSNK